MRSGQSQCRSGVQHFVRSRQVEIVFMPPLRHVTEDRNSLSGLAEAAQIVLNVPVRKVMVPLNVTHTALLTPHRHWRLLSPHSVWAKGEALPKAVSPLRHTLSSLLSFFAESYRTTFGFNDGPPLHDALTIAYVIRPDLFTSTRYRVDVELGTSLAMGEVTITCCPKAQTCAHTNLSGHRR